MTKKLFVGGISWNTNDTTLSEFFSQVGTVTSVMIITDKYTGKSKGFGFVEMSTEEEAELAKTKLNGQMLDGRSIAISEARPQQPRDQNDRNFGRRDDRRGGYDRQGHNNNRRGR